ncbi:MAG: hypothetical protein KAT90_10300 [Gammaproteobacteria bacterium]|nr:hypothetical protein [Gammaproteobacteria bacterium]
MTLEEKALLAAAAKIIEARMTDAHIAIEDRIGECVDDEFTPVYAEMDALKRLIDEIVVDL